MPTTKKPPDHEDQGAELGSTSTGRALNVLGGGYHT